jgi:hypothetical protein
MLVLKAYQAQVAPPRPAVCGPGAWALNPRGTPSFFPGISSYTIHVCMHASTNELTNGISSYTIHVCMHASTNELTNARTKPMHERTPACRGRGSRRCSRPRAVRRARRSSASSAIWSTCRSANAPPPSPLLLLFPSCIRRPDAALSVPPSRLQPLPPSLLLCRLCATWKHASTRPRRTPRTPRTPPSSPQPHRSALSRRTGRSREPTPRRAAPPTPPAPEALRRKPCSRSPARAPAEGR